jgi:putative glycosyltransferase (TIGR04372 family)
VSEPFKIFAFIGDRALGDFVIRTVVAATIKNNFENADLTVYYQNDRPYKKFTLECCPHIDTIIEQKDRPFLLDWFDSAWQPPFSHPNPKWYSHQFPIVDLFLTPSMMEAPRIFSMPNYSPLKIQESRVPDLSERLVEAGVDPDNWFVCMHMREGDYKYRKTVGDIRNVNVMTYIALARYIITTYGGQVVRIGDPSMQPITPMPGFVDLSQQEDIFDLQTFAVSRSRFYIGGSGPADVPKAFNVPAAGTDVMGPGLGRPNFHTLTKTIVAPDGKRYSQKAAYDADLLHGGVERLGYKVVDRSLTDLINITEFLISDTEEIKGWSIPEEIKITSYPNKLDFPMRMSNNVPNFYEPR